MINIKPYQQIILERIEKLNKSFKINLYTPRNGKSICSKYRELQKEYMQSMLNKKEKFKMIGDTFQGILLGIAIAFFIIMITRKSK